MVTGLLPYYAGVKRLATFSGKKIRKGTCNNKDREGQNAIEEEFVVEDEEEDDDNDDDDEVDEDDSDENDDKEL